VFLWLLVVTNHAAHSKRPTTDMDLCCLLDSKGPLLQASDLVTVLGDLLERGAHCIADVLFDLLLTLYARAAFI
jgi:hypothetical protein